MDNDRRTNDDSELSVRLASNTPVMAVLHHNNGDDGSGLCGDGGCHGVYGGERDNNNGVSFPGDGGGGGSGGSGGGGGGGGGRGGGHRGSSSGNDVGSCSVRSDTGRRPDYAADRGTGDVTSEGNLPSLSLDTVLKNFVATGCP